MKRDSRGFYSFLVFSLFVLFMVIMFGIVNRKIEENYTKGKLFADLEAGNVTDVRIRLNGETPTGALNVVLKNGGVKTLYVADVAEMEEIIRSYGFDPSVSDVSRQSWIMTTLVPMVIVIVVGVFLFMMINAQNAGVNAGNARMMNFGRSRARLVTGRQSVTFAQVAGLKEEKEDLQEIVDFLKDPGKYNKLGARIPKGVLLEGPPGTGKTLLAKAVAGEADVLDKILLGLQWNKVVDGHAPGLLGKDLDAYLVTGISNTHECASLEEMEENLRRGGYVLIREGSAARDLATLLPGVTPANSRRCAFCCDDRHPEDIERDGHMDNHLRRAVAFGMDPVQAVTMCTLNAAECFGLRHKGAVAPGRDADFLLVEDLRSFRISKVFAAGREVAAEGRMLEALRNVRSGESFGSSMHLAPLADDAFVLRVPGGRARVIGITPGSLVTRHEQRDVAVDKDGLFHCADNPELCKIAVIERHKASGRMGVGLLAGYGVKGGAVATTIAHDSHNVVVAGDNDADMLLAVRALADMGGGIVTVASGKVLGRLPLPIAGLLSDAPPAEVSATLGAMIEDARAVLGIPASVQPFMTLSFMALPVIPDLKITARGLFDVAAFAFTGLAVE